MSFFTSSIFSYFLRYTHSFFSVAKKLSEHALSYGQPPLLMLWIIPFSSNSLLKLSLLYWIPLSLWNTAFFSPYIHGFCSSLYLTPVSLSSTISLAASRFSWLERIYVFPLVLVIAVYALCLLSSGLPFIAGSITRMSCRHLYIVIAKNDVIPSLRINYHRAFS